MIMTISTRTYVDNNNNDTHGSNNDNHIDDNDSNNSHIFMVISYGLLATPKEIEQSKSTQTVVDYFRFCWGLLYIISTSPVSETGHPSY